MHIKKKAKKEGMKKHEMGFWSRLLLFYKQSDTRTETVSDMNIIIKPTEK